MKIHRLFSFLAVISLLFTAAGASYQPVIAKGSSPDVIPEFIPGEFVVGFAPGKTHVGFAAQANTIGQAMDVRVMKVSGIGFALMKADPDRDMAGLIATLRNQADILFVEPNYVYSIPHSEINAQSGSGTHSEYIIRAVKPGEENEYKEQAMVPVKALQSMKKRTPTNTITAVYPNDPYLWDNNGWDWVGASILTPNLTPSANICEIDTGVDYLHPDLLNRVIKGQDFVNGDTNPMDDNGHGTHVAGIMVANKGNGKGIAGVSTGKVVAVKALRAQGWGTNYDIALAINYCANRPDIRIINLSLGGLAQSAAMQTAINTAVNTKGKLIVAAAGNDHQDVPIYPAFFANNDPSGSADCAPNCPTFPLLAGKVLAVAAAGHWYQDPPDPDLTANQILDNACQGSFWGTTDEYYSNFGSWISVVAPGSSIYSTTPWDKTFYLNTLWGMDTRYAWLDGTSMAAPFVAAAAARRWGYHPLDNNLTVGADTVSSGSEINADGTCWDTSMGGKHQVNVAVLLNRGAMSANIFDTVTGNPLVGATLGVFSGTTLLGTGIVTPYTWKADYGSPEPTRVYTSYYPTAEVINIPAGGPYVPKVNKAGFTVGYQPALQHTHENEWVAAGYWTWGGRAGIPPITGNFSVSTGWWSNTRDDLPVPQLFDDWAGDLDADVWLPDTPNPLDQGQPAPFIVGWQGNTFGYLEDDPMGAMMAFPYAILDRDGGNDGPRVQSTTIAKRAAHGTLVANAALPYYPGDYITMMTDWGQTIDHDADGCGDNYASYPGYDPNYDPADDPDCPPNTVGGTLGIPLMGVYLEPWAYVWKDGVIKQFVMFNGGAGLVDPNEPCNTHWWKVVGIHSGISGAVTYPVYDECGDVPGIEPYHASGFSGRMGITGE